MPSFQLRTALADMDAFGLPQIAKYALARLAGGRPGRRGRPVEIELVVPGFGPVTIRVNDSDYHVMRQVLRDQDYQLTTAHAAKGLKDRYEAILAGGRTPLIIDAGANIGLTAAWFAQGYPEAKVLAVEPHPDNARMARKNAGRLANIKVVEAAIGGRQGFVDVIDGAQGSWAATTARAETGCAIVTIDDLLASEPGTELFIVKVDIEGFEKDLFDGDLGWLTGVSALFIEPHDWMCEGMRTSRGFQKAIADGDFDLYVRGENLFYLNRKLI